LTESSRSTCIVEISTEIHADRIHAVITESGLHLRVAFTVERSGLLGYVHIVIAGIDEEVKVLTRATVLEPPASTWSRHIGKRTLERVPEFLNRACFGTA